jgi:hypothetical protein
MFIEVQYKDILSLLLERLLVSTTFLLVGRLKSYFKRFCLIIIVGLMFRDFKKYVVVLNHIYGWL